MTVSLALGSCSSQMSTRAIRCTLVPEPPCTTFTLLPAFCSVQRVALLERKFQQPVVLESFRFQTMIDAQLSLSNCKDVRRAKNHDDLLEGRRVCVCVNITCCPDSDMPFKVVLRGARYLSPFFPSCLHLPQELVSLSCVFGAGLLLLVPPFPFSNTRAISRLALHC